MITKKVKKGDKVKVEYTGKLENGSVFDKNEDGKPLEFTVGSGMVILGFDKAVEGMKLNEEKTVNVKPEEAYGQRDENLIKEFPRNSLPQNFEPKRGQTLILQTRTGQKIPAIIVDVTENTITLDLNHPLAGKNLIFDIKVVGISSSE